MKWLEDEAIQEFLESSFLRVKFNEVHRPGANQAWVVLDTETKRYIGTITRNGSYYDTFTEDHPKGTRVRSFDTALQLIELPTRTEWKEGARPVGEV